MTLLHSKTWQPAKLGNIVSFKTGRLNSNAATPNGPYPFFTCSPTTLTTDSYSFDTECVLMAGNNASGVYTVKYFKGKFDAYQRTYVIRSLDDQCLLNRFLYYALRTKLEMLKSISTGAATKFLTLAILRDIEMAIPPLSTQHKIATILSAYDDLIENNLRRIKILEEMAQIIYREWFVNFRFPGHEKVEMMDSEFGPMPEGWEVGNVADVLCFRFVRENVAPYKGVKKYFATADVRGIEIVGEGITYTFEKKPSRAQKQPPVDSVWFARMKDTYKVLVFTDVNERLAKECMLSSGFAGFQASARGWLGYLYCTIKSDAFHEEKNRYCTGATQMSLTNEGLERIKVLAPDGRTAVAFNRLTAPVVSEILVLQARNATLRRTRDLLLPKLISGRLDVSELDIDMERAPQ